MKVNTTRIKLEDIYMDAVVKEDYEHTAKTTDKPVEKGQDISDHYKIKPIRVDISGMIVNDSEEKYETLKGYMKDAKLLKYIGLTSVKNMVIVNVTRKSSSEVKDGYYYDLSLKEVRIAVPETFEVKVKNPVTKKQDRKTASKVKAHSNKGRKQLKSTLKTAGRSSAPYESICTHGGLAPDINSYERICTHGGLAPDINPSFGVSGSWDTTDLDNILKAYDRESRGWAGKKRKNTSYGGGR
jgi:hypothetical protein